MGASGERSHTGRSHPVWPFGVFIPFVVGISFLEGKKGICYQGEFNALGKPDLNTPNPTNNYL